MMTKEQLTTQYEKWTPLLHRLAHACAGRCGRPEDEVFQQACYEFVRAAESFDAARGNSFGTYASVYVRNNLAQWGMKYPLAPDPLETEPVRAAEHARPDRVLMRREWLAGLSEDCREVVETILAGPADVLGLVAGRKATLGELKRHLRASGWTWPRIWNTIRTIKQEVATL